MVSQLWTSYPTIGVPPSSHHCTGARSPFHRRCPGTRRILELLRRRSHDAKPLVRKAALLALSTVLLHQDENDGVFFVSRDDLQVFYDACQDIAPSLRKRGVLDLTQLLERRHDDPRVKLAWLGAVLPLYNDREAAVQTACLTSILNTIVKPLLGTTDDISRGLSILEMGNVMSQKHFEKALHLLSSRRELPLRLYSALNKLLKSHSNSTALWCVLAAATSASQPEKLDYKTIVSIVDESVNRNRIEGQSCVYMLRCVGNISESLDSRTRMSFCEVLFSRLMHHECEISSISACLDCLSKISQDSDTHPSQLLRHCRSELEQFVLNDSKVSETRISHSLLCIGELYLKWNLSTSSTAPSRKLPQIDDRLIALVQSLCADRCAESIGAQAVLCLGKFALQNVSLARRLITLFVRELQNSASAVVRNNILVLMGDLARAFTSIVDPYAILFLVIILSNSNPLLL